MYKKNEENKNRKEELLTGKTKKAWKKPQINMLNSTFTASGFAATAKVVENVNYYKPS